MKNTFLITSALFICLMAVSIIAGGKSATMHDLEKRLETVKAALEVAESDSPEMSEYNLLAGNINPCALAKVMTDPAVRDLLAPAASLCANGSLATTDPTFNRPLSSSIGSGIGNGTAGNCSLSGSGSATRFDSYNVNVTGCTVFPTVVTASLCGPAGCTAPQPLDTILLLYRSVAAGDPLTANGGLPGAFNPTSPCTNARASNDDTSATSTTAGGSTCNQSNTADCTAQCGTSTALSQFKRSLGSGQFTIVVTGFGNTTVGNYNLYLDAPAAGCQFALVPATAAAASISGRVVLPDDIGLTNARVTLTDMQGASQTILTGKGGRFRFSDVQAGASYIINVAARLYTFAPQVVTVNEDLTEVNFAPLP